jgi:hypothetical protein
MAWIIVASIAAWCVLGAVFAVLVGGSFRRGWNSEHSHTVTAVTSSAPAQSVAS